MRIYEFCKQYELSTKDVILWLKEAGYDISSHMSALSDEAKEFLLKKIDKKIDNSSSQKDSSIVKQQDSQHNNNAKVEPKESPKIEAKQAAPSVTEKEQQVSPVQNVSRFHKNQSSMNARRPVQARQRTTVVSQQPKVVQHEKVELPLKPILLADLADKLHRQASDLIVHLLRQGKVVTKNQLLDEKMLRSLSALLGFDIKEDIAQAPVVAEVKQRVQEGTVQRAPVIVVIGHVDHGKTSFLDYVRKTRVASREKGGITQHLGAYEAVTKNGKVVFLDTPGHEAFTHMRKRGLSVADIAILMVAADDGVMPQTIEAINHAQQAGVPIIVALNKIDKVDEAQAEKVRASLSQYGLLPEEWGGQTMVIPISSKTGQNIDQLLDMLALQSEVMELKARTEGAGQGYVLESKMEKGRGAVATILLQNGTVKVGDFFVAGDITGKVSSMVNSAGVRVTEVGPAVPVQLSGFDTMPQAGDEFHVIAAEDYKIAKAKTVDHSSMLTQVAQQGQQHEDAVKLILKVDTNSSKEALVNAISKLSFKKAKLSIVFSSIGNINESDVQLAHTTKARIYGFGVKPESGVMSLAQRLGVAIELHYIIYHLIDEITAYAKSLEQPEKVIIKTGEAIVRKVFDIKNVGVIAGCYVKDGKIIKNSKAIVYRGNRKIGEGEIESLQRDKRAMKEVAAGFECAFIVKGHNDFAIDDRIECLQEQIQQQN
jgi:translation initiation factor IF-2